jgi:uncharacterized protein (UPF0210 family)
VRIRSITVGTNVSYALDPDPFRAMDAFQGNARVGFKEAGLELQTVRLATQPFPAILRQYGPSAAAPFAAQLEHLCRRHGIDYCAIGPAASGNLEDELPYIDAIPEVIGRTEMVFASVLVTLRGAGIYLEAIQRAAQVIRDVAYSEPSGFGNLRLAILANCAPGSPFFPAAFHHGPNTTFSVATEAADLAVDAFSRATTLAEARHNLIALVEERAAVIRSVCIGLEQSSGFCFGGIDFSLAPYPEVSRSIGEAIERLGVDAFGGSATLFAAAFLTQALRDAQFPRCGFSGLFFPVLEDEVLARRSTESLYSLDSLLLYSAVCGTGLDTVPLPGDVGVDELAAILLDVATLATVLDKPLTARLMPIPGKKAGDVTSFDFPYFANAQILDVRRSGSRAIFESNRSASLCARTQESGAWRASRE